TFDAFCKMNSDYSERILCAPGPTPIWDLTQARLQHEMDWVSFIRQLPADAPGKRRYVTFLLERYRHQFHTINQLYGSRARQGEDLLEYPFAKVSWQDPQIFRDDRWFLGEIEQQFQKVNFQIYRGLSPQFLLQLPDFQAVPQSKSRIAEYGKIIL
ncbi:MAG: hypothetical protein KJT03_22600, partial [Verrucomicrobiae bacterium]|nr:hypothetical protein [Verrucomicrobiae bacterium]